MQENEGHVGFPKFSCTGSLTQKTMSILLSSLLHDLTRSGQEVDGAINRYWCTIQTCIL